MAAETGFPHEHAPRLEALFRESGASGVIAFIRGFAEPRARAQLYSLAQRRMGGSSWADLDEFTALVNAAIDESLAQARDAPDDEQRRKLVDSANVLSYNLSAALADCWPGDDRPRTREHLRAGLAAADRCLQWRRELGKGPGPFSMAWWARGIHLLALGEVSDAASAFDASLEHAKEGARAAGASAEHDATGDWSVLLGWGYCAIAHERLSGDGSGVEAALAALDAAVAARPGDADDLRFCAEQLREARARHSRARNSSQVDPGAGAAEQGSPD